MCLLACLQPGWEQRDSERRLAIEAACSAHLAAAAAAAATVEGASAEEAAKAAYEAAFQKAKEAASNSASAAAAAEAKKAAEAETATKGAVATKLAAAGTSATSMLRQRMAGGGGGGGGAGGGAGASTAVGDAAGREIEEREKKADEDDDLPEYMKGGFSWKVGWLLGSRFGWFSPVAPPCACPVLCYAGAVIHSTRPVPSAESGPGVHAAERDVSHLPGHLPHWLLDRARPPAVGAMSAAARWQVQGRFCRSRE